MAETVRETTIRTGNAVRKTTEIADDRPVVDATPQRDAAPNIAARIIWFIAGVIITLLLLRFVLILFGANQGNGFVDFIYAVSYPFAVPFFGIFGYDLQYGAARVEISSLFAAAVYALVAWGLAKLVTITRR